MGNYNIIEQDQQAIQTLGHKLEISTELAKIRLDIRLSQEAMNKEKENMRHLKEQLAELERAFIV